MSQVISDDVMIYLHISLNIIARTIISIVGVATNFINMVIFSKLGLKDSMSVGLFFLSLTDFLVTSVQLVSSGCFIIEILSSNTGTDVRFVGYYTLGWAITALYDISCWITAMVSVERCYCVVSPFRVRQVFTRFRCIVVTVTVYLIYIGLHSPIYLHERMELSEVIILSENNITNTSSKIMFTIIINQTVQMLEFILDLSAGVVMWLISQAVIIACTVWMIYSLKMSSTVRRHTTYDQQYATKTTVSSQHKSTLSSRERRMVKVVLFLALTTTSCNVPKLITTVIFYTFPDANSGKEDNLSTVLWTVAIMFGSLGCSVSFVVYLTLNAKYRQEFAYMFGCLPQSQ